MASLQDENRERYWSPTQVTLFAHTVDGAIWIDDAIGIDLRIQDQRTPHFGFRDNFFRTVSYGRSIVSGNLYIAFRYPNYLSDAVQFAGLNDVTPRKIGGAEGFKYSSAQVRPRSNTTFSTENRQVLFEAMRENIQKYALYAEEFKKAFYNGEGGQPQQNTSDQVEAGTVRRIVHSKRSADVQRTTKNLLSIQIRYGDHTIQDEPTYLRYVDGIVLTGETHPITVLDGNGDQALIEVYSFFARAVRAV